MQFELSIIRTMIDTMLFILHLSLSINGIKQVEYHLVYLICDGIRSQAISQLHVASMQLHAL
jgi:hypothetical protein